MYLRKNFNKKTGVYRTKSSIEQFKFRVNLKTLHSLIKVPQFQISNRAITAAVSDNPDEIETHIINWQQKRLNSKEIEKFSDPNNCKTDIHKDYLRMIRENNLILDDGKNSNKIFTYISDDCYIAETEMDTAKNEKECDGNFEKMYIMAYLQQETVLFTIKRHTDGLLLIYPDFNNLDNDPYLIEIDSDSRHMYQYSIEMISDTDFKRDKIDQDIDGELQFMSKRLSDLSIKTLFDLPPRRCTNVYLFIEIKSAKYFEYDNIHIRYHITLPYSSSIITVNNNDNALISNKCGNQSFVEGCTHSSLKCQNNDGEDIWKFGYCHELSILCNEDYRFDDFLKITYEVISIDGWNRERTEGYTSQRIPFIAGITSDKLPCYRDLGENTIVQRLERFFIGGRIFFDSNQFNGITTEPCSKLNRYGNQMKSTGYIYVSKHIIVQHDVNVLNSLHHQRHETYGGKKIQMSKNRITIDDVVVAYQKAKQRLEEATSKQ